MRDRGAVAIPKAVERMSDSETMAAGSCGGGCSIGDSGYAELSCAETISDFHLTRPACAKRGSVNSHLSVQLF